MIFFAILNFVFLRPVGEAIRKRREYIDGVKGDYDRYRHQIEGLNAKRKRNARRPGAKPRKRCRSRAPRPKPRRPRSPAKYAGEASAIVAQARAEVDKELGAARERGTAARRPISRGSCSTARSEGKSVSDAFYQNLALWSQVGGSLAFFIIVVWLWRRFLGPAILSGTVRKNAELAESEKRRDEAKDSVEDAQRALIAADDDVRAIRSRAGARRRRRTRAAGRPKRRTRASASCATRAGELARLRRSARETLRDELVARALEIAREAATKVDATTDRRLLDESLGVLEGGNR